MFIHHEGTYVCIIYFTTFASFAMDYYNIFLIGLHPCEHILTEIHQITSTGTINDDNNIYIYIYYSPFLRESWNIVIIDEYPLNLVVEVACIIFFFSYNNNIIITKAQFYTLQSFLFCSFFASVVFGFIFNLTTFITDVANILTA